MLMVPLFIYIKIIIIVVKEKALRKRKRKSKRKRADVQRRERTCKEKINSSTSLISSFFLLLTLFSLLY